MAGVIEQESAAAAFPAARPDVTGELAPRVAIVDDHESVLLGLRAACLEADIDVVAVGTDLPSLAAALDGRIADVVVLDLSLGDGSIVGANVARAHQLGRSVLIHSIADRVSSVREALAGGAAGVIPKSAKTATVIAAIRTVAAGGVLNNLEWASAIDADVDFARATLTNREREVLHLYASGLPLRRVAEQLAIADGTAREYLSRIRSKYVELGRPARTKIELLRRAVEDGIVEIDDGAR